MISYIIRILGSFVLLLLSLVLCVILYNAIKRCQIQTAIQDNDNDKFVDLFVENMVDIPVDASPGMSVLIDKGHSSLETGIYVLRSNNSPSKIAIPMPNERYRISSGVFAGHVHTIRQQFVEIRPPSNTQTFDHTHLIQKLQSTTSCIVVKPDTAQTCQLQCDAVVGVMLSIANLSENQQLILLTSKHQFAIGPFIGLCYLDDDKATFSK